MTNKKSQKIIAIISAVLTALVGAGATISSLNSQTTIQDNNYGNIINENNGIIYEMDV